MLEVLPLLLHLLIHLVLTLPELLMPLQLLLQLLLVLLVSINFRLLLFKLVKHVLLQVDYFKDQVILLQKSLL